MEKESIDLNAPAFGPGSQKVETPVVEQQEAPVAEAVVEATEAVQKEEAPEDSSVEENKVPYSRFRKFYTLAQEAQREAEEWRTRAQELAQREPERVSEPTDVPSWWRELYGDSDVSQKAWKIQEQANQELIERARSEALAAVQSERVQETERVRTNEEIIDASLDALSDYAGHSLSEREQSAVLDIVDEYTPKGDDGNYLGATIPFEKAWDIYEMQQQLAKNPKAQARNKVAELTAAPTHGEPEAGEKDKSFNPLDWNAWKKRI